MAKKGKYGKVELSEEEITFIRENFKSMTNKQLAEALGLKQTHMRTLAYSMGLYKQEMEYWTEEQVRLLLENYKTIGDTEIAEMFQTLFHKNKGWTKKHIEKKRRYLKLKRTKEEIKAIHARNVANGLFAMCPINAWKTRGGASPEGTLLKWHVGGRPIMHIKLNGKYVHAHRVMWEKAHGPIPKGMMITFKNMDTTDLRLENLDMISKQEAGKYSINSDRYVAALIDGASNRDEVLKHPELIQLKRKQLELNRAIKSKKNNDTGRN